MKNLINYFLNVGWIRLQQYDLINILKHGKLICLTVVICLSKCGNIVKFLLLT